MSSITVFVTLGFAAVGAFVLSFAMAVLVLSFALAVLVEDLDVVKVLDVDEDSVVVDDGIMELVAGGC